MNVTVYHAKELFPRYLKAADISKAINIGWYTKVAVVVVPDGNPYPLDYAYEQTNNIDASWTINADVVAEPGNHRSTSVGDLMVCMGRVYVVAPVGFTHCVGIASLDN